LADQFGRNFELPKGLRENGHEVMVLALDYKGKKIECLTISGVLYLSLPIFSFLVFNSVIEAKKQIKMFKPTHVISSGDSHIGYVGLLLARMSKAKSIFDVYDYYPSFGSNRFPFMKKMFHHTLRNVDLVLCASRNLVTYTSKFASNILMIENGVDTNKFKVLDKTSCRKELDLGLDEIIIGYFGSMEPMRGVEYLIKACESLRQHFPELKLLIAGKASRHIKLKSEWIDYRGQVDQDQVVKMINASNVVAIPYLSSPLVDYGNSCKIGEYLACQVPIVATSVANLSLNYHDVINEIPLAICESGNAKALAKVIIYQIETKKLASYPERINWSRLTEKLEMALLKLS